MAIKILTLLEDGKTEDWTEIYDGDVFKWKNPCDSNMTLLQYACLYNAPDLFSLALEQVKFSNIDTLLNC